jgi:hypothetical protein
LKPFPPIGQAALGFAVAGVAIPLLLLGFHELLAGNALKVGGFSLGYWALQCLLMFAPLAPFVLTPSSGPWDWIVPYAIMLIGNAIIYAAVGALSAVLVQRLGWYLTLTVAVLGVMLLLTDEWLLLRWVFGALPTDELRTLGSVLRVVHLQYFALAAAIVLVVFGWRYLAFNRKRNSI